MIIGWDVITGSTIFSIFLVVVGHFDLVTPIEGEKREILKNKRKPKKILIHTSVATFMINGCFVT